MKKKNILDFGFVAAGLISFAFLLLKALFLIDWPMLWIVCPIWIWTIVCAIIVVKRLRAWVKEIDKKTEHIS